MDGITLMVEEHKNIKRMLAVMRKACFKLMNGDDIDYGDFEKMIDFVRSYADKHHHGKEEQILFNRMVDEMGGAAEKLVKFGMLVEHDLGRLHMMELEKAIEKVKSGDDEARLDIIANAISYTHLLHRHIEKEDDIAYPFARRGLCQETLDTINRECEAFESDMQANGVQEKYMGMLVELEGKYNS